MNKKFKVELGDLQAFVSKCTGEKMSLESVVSWHVSVVRDICYNIDSSLNYVTHQIVHDESIAGKTGEYDFLYVELAINDEELFASENLADEIRQAYGLTPEHDDYQIQFGTD